MRRLLALAVCVAAVAFPPRPGFACSCAIESPAEYLKRADVVFSGEATRIDESGAILFRVDRVHKGSLGGSAAVSTKPFCAVPFAAGRSYTVFAQSEGGRLVTSLCGGTSENPGLFGGPTGGSSPGLERSGSPSPVGEPVAAPGAPAGESRGGAILLALGLALVAAVALLRARPIGAETTEDPPPWE